jgi:flagellar hook protein FlgE
MMRSLYSGVAGLRTHQTKMDVLGNNIANVNSTSYKSQSITFSDLMYQTTQAASGATQTKGGINARQIGLGSKSGAISTAIESQGATQTTNNPFDIMITGKSFFVVNNGQENLYTRDGSFYLDGAGNLAMQSNGYYVMGWAAKEDAETGEIKIDKNSGLTSLQIMSADNSTYAPASTTQALFSGNIDDNDTNIISDEGKTITLEFYDNKGYLYTAKFILKDTTTDNVFSLQLSDIIDSDGYSIGADKMEHVTFGTPETMTTPAGLQNGYTYAGGNFTGTGTYPSYTGVPTSGNVSTLLSVADGNYKGLLQNVYNISDADARTYGTAATYTIDGAGNITLTGGDKTITLEFNPANGKLVDANDIKTGLVNIIFDQTYAGLEPFGYQKLASDGPDVIPGRLTVDLSTVTNLNTSGTATIKALKGDKKSLNTGRMVGEMNGVTVSTDGKVTATYSNGQTKLLGQIASAEFANASGLSKEGDNLYAQTLNSGDATIQDITFDGGYMTTGVLEMSNVDLSKEFTEMITTQRGFQANSRIITVSDTLLEELTNLKR